MCALVIMLNVGKEDQADQVEKVKATAEKRNRKYAELLLRIWDQENEHDKEMINQELKSLLAEEMMALEAGNEPEMDCKELVAS